MNVMNLQCMNLIDFVLSFVYMYSIYIERDNEEGQEAHNHTCSKCYTSLSFLGFAYILNIDIHSLVFITILFSA